VDSRQASVAIAGETVAPSCEFSFLDGSWANLPRSMRATPTLCVAATLLLAGVAQAQTLPSLDVRTWRPSTDPGASLVLEPMQVPGLGEWNVGAWLDYANHPVTLRLAGTKTVAFRPVENTFGGDLTGSVGIGARLALGVDLPVFFYQNGSTNLPSTISTTSTVPTTGLGDLTFNVKGAIIGNELGGFGLAAVAAVDLPTGDRTSFLGDGAVDVTARLLADYSLVFADLQASLGYTLRTEHREWPAASVGGYDFGDTIPWSVGIRVSPTIFKIDRENRQTWEIAGHGWLPAGPVGPFGTGQPGGAAMSPALLALSDRIGVGHYRDVFVLAGVDIGLNTAVGVPTVRFMAAAGWSPRSHDKDKDGIPDDVDQCPEIPEDKDGFEDADGCPDIDDDDDGIIDKEDACPRVPGVPSTDPKKNGCPPPDSDGDGIPDTEDACPHLKGVKSDDPKRNGCPTSDRDGDGIPDDIDKCPDQPEDKDGFQDDDGCPDPDNDGDGIPDAVDACPNVPGEPSTDPKKNGCPNPDRDGDAYDNDNDQCPDAAEVYNGVKDDDGCPDEGGHPLVVVDEKGPRPTVRFAKPLKFVGHGEQGETLDDASMLTLRAFAQELNRHRDWTVAVRLRRFPAPGHADAQDQRAELVSHTLMDLTHRDDVATVMAWDNPAFRTDGSVEVLIVTPSAPVPPHKLEGR
jgi:OOP family OmpA-OmpF porin